MQPAIWLALAAAALYGASDFLGGLLSRRVHYGLVGLIGQCAAAVGGLTAALAVGTHPTPSAIVWGMAAGIGGAIGTLALYRGLSRGQMNVAGPLSAVGAAGLPIPVDLMSGREFTALALLGLGLAIPGIWLVSLQSGGRGSGGVGPGLLAGLGFAGLFICLDQAGDDAGLWPVAASQLSGAVVLAAALAAFALAGRRDGAHHPFNRRPPWAALWPGVLGVGATLLYFLATSEGTLAVSAVITSLYPAFTVALAAAVLRERTNLVHAVGLLLCAVSVGAFAAG